MKIFNHLAAMWRSKRPCSVLKEDTALIGERLERLYRDNLEKAIEVMAVPRKERWVLTKNGLKKGRKEEVFIVDLADWILMASIKTRIRWHVNYALNLEEPRKTLELCRISREKETFWMIEELVIRGTSLNEILNMCGERLAAYKLEYLHGNKRYGNGNSDH